ncbi:GvpT/GvpP family gas vesicle accessory protein [Rossellomorea sp. AcN35-11]|nr:gas vesicle protein GvpP [Rossellomorea aquimaris]WJV30593.1 GvpT/GvpP family gas vesicle accessory protein [Rossellomorea sp. AcN35-11]
MTETKASRQAEETKSNEQNEEQTVENRHSMNYALIGGVVGAGIGLLSNPGTGKKVVDSLGKSEVVKAASKELRRSAQEFLTEQLIITLRQSAAGYMGRLEGGFQVPKKKKEEASGNSDLKSEEKGKVSAQSAELEDIKEENKNLGKRLERIEEMLSHLVESKK